MRERYSTASDSLGALWLGLVLFVFIGIIFACSGCAPIEQRPERRPEVRLQTVEVPYAVPVPCFTEAERPVLPPPTPVDIENATTDQLVAALAADAEALELYGSLVDKLFIRCMKAGAKP